MFLIDALIAMYELVLIARVVFSWLPPKSRRNVFYDFIYQATEPVLRPIRNVLPIIGGFDFSPIVVFIGLHILRSALI